MKSNLTFGIYWVTIEGNISPYIFRKNKFNFYKSIAINRAIKLGLKVKHIIDGEYNALTYSKDSYTTGETIFKKYVAFF